MNMYLDNETAIASFRAAGKVGGAHRRWAISVFALVRNQSNYWLLVRQRQNGRWNLPGGRVRPGEAFRHALAREFQEETGRLLLCRTRLAGLVEDTERMRLFLFYRAATNPHAAATPVNAHEISEAAWFPVTALPASKCEALHQWLRLGAWTHPLSQFRMGSTRQRLLRKNLSLRCECAQSPVSP
jgi:8-oxo-dGTP diphosphatase